MNADGGGEHGDLDRLIETIKQDHVDATLSRQDRAMLDFAIKLTLTPQRMTEADVESLRAQRFCDTAISDVVQVTALFNYYNRIADGLGIDPEEDWEPTPE